MSKKVRFPTKTISFFAVLFSAIFLLFGDFLPQPLRGASQQTRTTLNNAVLGLFPSWRPKTKPYERTEKALEEEQKKTK